MTKTERKTRILNAIVMYLNSMPVSEERTDLLHLMQELEEASPRNTFCVNIACLYSIGAKTEQVIEVINKELNIDLIKQRGQKSKSCAIGYTGK